MKAVRVNEGSSQGHAATIFEGPGVLGVRLRLSARRRALARLGLESEPNSRKGMDPMGGARLAMGEGERGERGALGWAEKKETGQRVGLRRRKRKVEKEWAGLAGKGEGKKKGLGWAKREKRGGIRKAFEQGQTNSI